MTELISIVVPVYRAEDCLRELYSRLVAVMGSISPNFELILVDDASPDRSWSVLKDLAEEDPRVKAVRMSRNFGQHYAITAGLDRACGDWVIVMDCDLQDRPEEIAALYQKAKEGYDAVFARRINRKDSWGKRLRSHLFARLMGWLIGAPFDGSLSNFSISSKRAVEAFRAYRERDRAFYLILRDIGYPLACLDVEHGARYAGETSYTWSKLFRFAAQVVVSSSTRPLHLSIRLGGVISSLSFLYAVYLVARYFLRDVGVPGWTSLAVLISFFFGLLFMQLGITGLYLGKTFEETKHRPLYHVSESRNFGEA